jgi:NADPH-dependent curcumin reductase CurA
MVQNTQIQLVSRPDANGPRPDNFGLVQMPLRALAEGDVLLKTEYLSLDPYMRARMYEGINYAENAKLGAPMVGSTVARVLESRNSDFREGDYVESWHGWQSHHISTGQGLRKIDPSIAPVSTALGVLGMPGHTGYGGILRHGRPQPGETVVVSAASGTVGGVAAQIARIKGARVVGIAGGPEKCDFLTGTLRLDAAVDHRAPDFATQLAAACPDGVDVYFDNVGGEVFAAVLSLMNAGGRIPVCGTISVNRDGDPQIGEDRMNWILSRVLVRQLTISGFIYPQFFDLTAAFHADVSAWIASGELAYREDIVEGLENAPEAFLGLFEGRNFGKLLVRP